MKDGSEWVRSYVSDVVQLDELIAARHGGLEYGEKDKVRVLREGTREIRATLHPSWILCRIEERIEPTRVDLRKIFLTLIDTSGVTTVETMEERELLARPVHTSADRDTFEWSTGNSSFVTESRRLKATYRVIEGPEAVNIKITSNGAEENWSVLDGEVPKGFKEKATQALALILGVLEQMPKPRNSSTS